MDPVIVTFGEFVKEVYPEDGHNLYIVWYEDQALYVGISKSNLWVRWFSRFGAHIYMYGKRWVPNTRIGQVIVGNRPESLSWKIEFRHYKDVDQSELDLIRELCPLFNIRYSQHLNKKQQELKEKLWEPIFLEYLKDPPEDYISYAE